MLAALLLIAGPPQADLELRLDRAIETALAREYEDAAPALYSVYSAMPEEETKRDIAQFHLAETLRALGYTQAAVEHYIDVVSARRAPEMVAKSLTALDQLTRKGLVEENRLIDDVLFGAELGELDRTTQGFVDYFQALGELRRGYAIWGEQRLNALAAADNPYAFKARYVLAVLRLKQDKVEDAEKLLKALVDDKQTPHDVKNDVRNALGRLRYEQERYTEAFDFYAQLEKQPAPDAPAMFESAWSKVNDNDEQRGLGYAVALGAPMFKGHYAPERDFLRAFSLNKLCQFRAAHKSVLSFRAQHGAALRGIRERQPLSSLPLLMQAATTRDELVEIERLRTKTLKEQTRLSRVDDGKLKTHLDTLYKTRSQLLDRKRDRRLDGALERAAEELLSVDEQMALLDYEIGVGLFKRIGNEKREEQASLDVKHSPNVYYKFTGEYWSDELRDYAVLAADRCVR